MRIGRRIVSLVTAVWITASVAVAAHAEPLRIFYFIWIGSGPFFVAKEKGFFAKEGVDVDLIKTEVHSPAFAGLFAGQVDAITGVVQDAPAYFEPDEEPLVCALALDDDRGGTPVTYEPFLSQAKGAEHGHLLIDDSHHPGLVVDCLLTTAGVFDRRKDDFKAVARAWDAAVNYVADRPDEANEIMARSMGEDPAAFADMTRLVALYDKATSSEYFGTPEEPGQIYQTMQYAIDIWSEQGLLDFELSPADVIVHGIWDE